MSESNATKNHTLLRERLGVLRDRKPELARQIQIYALIVCKGLKLGALELKALGVDRESQLEMIRDDIDKLLRELASELRASQTQEEAHRGG